MAAVSRVVLTQNAFYSCFVHSLTTEQEEIMGLLLGDTKSGDGVTEVLVWGMSVLLRSDKRKDRVEISPEQLSQAAEAAEQLGKRINRRTRVIGWYHSHPHITVLPSHVDVRTQHHWQQMDPNFVGLIFACFGKAQQQTVVRNQVIAFQAADTQDPSSSRRLHPTVIREAMASGQRFGRIVVPLSIVPISRVLSESNSAQLAIQATLGNIVELQRILLREEKTAYYNSTFSQDHEREFDRPELKRAVSPTNAQKVDLHFDKPGPVFHPLSATHNAAVYTKMLCKLLEQGCLPALQAVQQDIEENNVELQRLREANAQLRAKLAALPK